VAVQIANARRFVQEKGWQEEIIEIIVEGESGAEFHERSDIQRVLALLLEGRVRRVVVRDLDRVARNALWQCWLLAELDRAAAELWTYADGQRPELRGLGFAMTTLRSVMAESERAQTAKRIREGLRERAQQGHAVGARRFGYRVVVSGKTKRWETNESEAAVAIHLGQTFAASGGSLRATALRLNAEGVPSPSGGTWNHVAVKSVLVAPLPRGVLVHGARRSLERGGSIVSVESPAGEVLRVPHPELKIWPDDLLAQIDTLLVRRRRVGAGAAAPRHLGSSFLACGVCGSGLTVSGSQKGGKAYVCTRHLQHGRRACPGIGYRSERAVDAALLAVVAPLLDRRRVMAKLRERIENRRGPNAREAERGRLSRALAEAERESRNLGRVIARDDNPPAALVSMVREQDERASALREQLERLEATPPSALSAKRLLSRARGRLTEFSRLHDKGGCAARPLLLAVLGGGRFTATPVEVQGQRHWQLVAKVSGGWLVSNVGSPSSCSFPSCTLPRVWRGASRRQPPTSRPLSERAPLGARARSRPGRPPSCRTFPSRPSRMRG
jgi:DNA invertase Pin-like site-specific DNA recombinase